MANEKSNWLSVLLGVLSLFFGILAFIDTTIKIYAFIVTFVLVLMAIMADKFSDITDIKKRVEDIEKLQEVNKRIDSLTQEINTIKVKQDLMATKNKRGTIDYNIVFILTTVFIILYILFKYLKII
ncbi:MAG: hypothetical protein J4451_02085 [DPANN group archaeon]|nr:hypothetical protein [DPANN group archaeon]